MMFYVNLMQSLLALNVALGGTWGYQNILTSKWEVCLKDTTDAVTPENINSKQAPYQLSLEINTTGKFEHVCGAAIIHEWVAVTAKSCVFRHNQLIPLKNLRLRSNRTILGDQSDSSKNHNIKKIIPYSAFEQNRFEIDDIALLFVHENFTYSSDSYKPLKLPVTPLPIGTTAAVTGWGNTDVKQRSEKAVMHVRSVSIQVIWNSICDLIYSETRYGLLMGDPTFAENKFICAGRDDLKTVGCTGDIGGPLYYNNVLYGIVSWAEGCGRSCRPAVYANVYYYADWIRFILDLNNYIYYKNDL